MPITFQIIVLIIVVIVISISFGRVSQSPDNFKQKIIDELEKNGYKLIDIQVPGFFKTGPFPFMEFSISPQTRIFGVSGEKVCYRIVRYKDNIGLIKKSWIKINVRAFAFVEIKWIPEL